MAVNLETRALGRRKIRYMLFRIQNEIPVDREDGLREYFEGQLHFDGWHNFNKTWDVGTESTWPNGHFLAVPLKRSAEDKWNDKLLELAQDWPFDQPGLIEDEEVSQDLENQEPVEEKEIS